MTLPLFDIQPVLTGKRVLLRPLVVADYDGLFAVASDPEIWAMHPFRDRYKREVFDDFFGDAIASQGAFAVLDTATGEIIGCTRFANYDAVADEIEIGWTFFATAYWRTGVNRDVKALMLDYVFQFVQTVVFQVGANNFRSRTAVERLGGKLVLEHKRDYGGQLHDYTTYHLTREDALSGALSASLAVQLAMRGESALERRFWTFWLVGILLLAAQIVMNIWLVTDASPLGMSDHQAAGSAARVDIIHAGWAAAGVKDLAIYSMELDLMFIVVYAWGAFAGGQMFAASSQAMLARLGKVVMIAAIGFAISDFAETISQLVQAAGTGGVDLLANIAAKMRPIKTILFLVTFFGLLVALGIRRMARHVA